MIRPYNQIYFFRNPVSPHGQEITAKVVDLNEAEKKISLSMKALESDSQGYADEETEA